MINKFFSKALIVCLLLALFSCSEELSNDSTNFIENNTNIREIKGVNLNRGISIDVVITNYDTIIVFSKYNRGSVIIDRRPTKVEY